MKTTLWIDNTSERCGIVQYGLNTCQILELTPPPYRFVRVQAGSPNDLHRACVEHRPGVVIINTCGGLAWINPHLMHVLAERQFAEIGRTIRFVGFRHDHPPSEHTLSAVIDVDPEIGAPRPVPLYRSQAKPPLGLPVIGSFGFGFGNKGYARVLERVASDFPGGAVARFHIPFAAYGDHDGTSAKSWAADLDRRRPAHVRVEVTHDFLPHVELIDWLASNHLNAFFYDRNFGRGPASTIDYALAARRPIAITDSWQFRHIVDAKPRILVESRSLSDILESGLEPLLPYYEKWSPGCVRAYYIRLVESLETT